MALGVDRIEGGWRFALWAPRATHVELVLVDRRHPSVPVRQVSLQCEHDVWCADVGDGDVGAADLYGYRVHGRWAPLAGDRFDPSKVLLDPRATEVWWPPGDRRTARDQARVRGVDTLGLGPLGVLPASSAPGPPPVGSATRPPRPHLPVDQLVIQETHVRSITRSPSSPVTPAHRGTFAGLVEVLDEIAALGVTAVELLPVHQVDPGEGSCWGYMPLAYLAIEQSYAAGDDAAAELALLADELHRRGMELIVDVVYNHTTEEDHLGPCWSWRGIDNRAHYVLDDAGGFGNESGCGNVLRLADPGVADLVLASLDRLADLGVDGIRFDLASALGRDAGGGLQERSEAIDRITEWGRRRDVRLIAEPWDLGAYQVGPAFPGRSWMQWNGRFRDDVRSYVKGDRGFVDAVRQRVQGSPDLYPDTPARSVNFVVAHDGFTLYDLVSYQHKHNEANGHGNTDGADDNRSWNCGWEGDDGVPGYVLGLRQRQVRNLLTLLALSAGVPMVLAGDEGANTQRGNNNPYRLDDDTTWIDWDRRRAHADLHRFTTELLAFRRAHPSIGRPGHWGADVTFLGPLGSSAEHPEEAQDHAFGWVLRGGSLGDADIVVLSNAHWSSVEMGLPDGDWVRVVDTALPAPDDIVPAGGPRITAPTYWVAPRATVVLISAG